MMSVRCNCAIHVREPDALKTTASFAPRGYCPQEGAASSVSARDEGTRRPLVGRADRVSSPVEEGGGGGGGRHRHGEKTQKINRWAIEVTAAHSMVDCWATLPETCYPSGCQYIGPTCTPPPPPVAVVRDPARGRELRPRRKGRRPHKHAARRRPLSDGDDASPARPVAPEAYTPPPPVSYTPPPLPPVAYTPPSPVVYSAPSPVDFEAPPYVVQHRATARRYTTVRPTRLGAGKANDTDEDEDVDEEDGDDSDDKGLSRTAKILIFGSIGVAFLVYYAWLSRYKVVAAMAAAAPPPPPPPPPAPQPYYPQAPQ